jgi:hypothetical protein
MVKSKNTSEITGYRAAAAAAVERARSKDWTGTIFWTASMLFLAGIVVAGAVQNIGGRIIP